MLLPGVSKVGNRACESCRRLKVRCNPSVGDTPAARNGTCQRCAKANRQCIFKAPTRTRVRKRTDVRVQELEKQVKALNELLKPKDGDSISDLGSPDRSYRENTSPGAYQVDRGYQGDVKYAATSESGSFGQSLFREDRSSSKSTQGSLLGQVESSSGDLDLDYATILTDTYANELFTRYCQELVPHYPAVVFTPSTTIQSLRSRSEVLFLAVMASAAGKNDPFLFSLLNKSLEKLYAEQIMVNGSKSIELVQALLLSSIWLYPPDDFSKLKYNQYAQMAASMAMEIGLDGRCKEVGRKLRARQGDFHQDTASASSSINEADLENCRTLLSCYLICASVSLSFRRANSLRFTTSMGEGLDALANSQEAAPSDKQLAAWIRLQLVMESAGSSLGLDDQTCESSLEDVSIQSALLKYENQTEEWRAGVLLDACNATTKANWYYNNILLHEIVLYEDHEKADFKPPFKIERTRFNTSFLGSSSQVKLSSLTRCLSSTHLMLDTLLAIPASSMQASPSVNFSRMSYGVFILFKILISVQSPESNLYFALDLESLKILEYLESLVRYMRSVANHGECRIATKFLKIIENMAFWHQKRVVRELESFTQPIAEDEDERLVEPLRRLSVSSSYGPLAFDLEAEEDFQGVRTSLSFNDLRDAFRQDDFGSMLPTGYDQPAGFGFAEVAYETDVAGQALGIADQAEAAGASGNIERSSAYMGT